jgi:hypothetical protein
MPHKDKKLKQNCLRHRRLLFLMMMMTYEYNINHCHWGIYMPQCNILKNVILCMVLWYSSLTLAEVCSGSTVNSVISKIWKYSFLKFSRTLNLCTSVYELNVIYDSFAFIYLWVAVNGYTCKWCTVTIKTCYLQICMRFTSSFQSPQEFQN